MDASSAQTVNIRETFNTYQYIIYISALTISTSPDFRDLVPLKGRLMCTASVLLMSKHGSEHCAFFVTIPCQTSPVELLNKEKSLVE